jgi:hypothetical protein
MIETIIPNYRINTVFSLLEALTRIEALGLLLAF